MYFKGELSLEGIKIIKLIGQGSQGEVFKAYSKPLNKIVALKCIKNTLKSE